MPEKSAERQTPMQLLDDSKFGDYIMSLNDLRAWSSRNEDRNTKDSSQNVADIVNNLLETKIISDNASRILKREKSLPCNPALVMDLRHEMAKNKKQMKHCYQKTDILTEAKRIILQEEMEKLAMEKELIVIDREIDSFKKQMDINRRKLSEQMKGMQMNTYKRIRFNKNELLNNEDNILNSSGNVLQSSTFSKATSEIKLQNEIISNSVNNFLVTEIPLTAEDTKPHGELACTNEVTVADEREVYVTKYSMPMKQSNEVIDNNQDLLCFAWTKWRKYSLDKKLKIRKGCTSETKAEASQAEQTWTNKKVVRKYWDTWLQLVREKKKMHSAAHNKLQREEKIDKFLKVLQEEKQSLLTTQTPALMKGFHNVRTITGKKSEHCNHVQLQNNKQKNTKCEELQSSPFSNDLNNHYQHRLDIQQNIIAEQKYKLEEQSKFIKELQLEHLRLQTEKSTKEAEEQINQTLSSCDLRLKPKAKQLKSRLATSNTGVEFAAINPVVVSLKTTPIILTRMEERALERQNRWKLIKEKKQKLVEEKERKTREEEEEKKQEEKWEKQQKLEELREKRRLEKEVEIQKRKERERMHNLTIEASFHYKMVLMKNVIHVFQQIVMFKKKLTVISKNHYKTKLLCNCFKKWRIHVQSTINFRIQKACSFYKKLLLKKSFKVFFQVYNEYIAKIQVAFDFYELRLQEHVFNKWYQVSFVEHMETVYKLEEANIYFNRKLLAQCFKSWQKLPSILKLERKKEQRKQIWRMKVQEMLPDFKPVPDMLDDNGLTS